MILAARRPVLPDQVILETTQDRLIEKDFVKRLASEPPIMPSVLAADLRAGSENGLPAVSRPAAWL